MNHTSIRTFVLALSLTAPATFVAAQTNDADQRLKALYTAEWEWRQKEEARVPGEFGREAADDHLPRVDAATQRKRLDYWQKTRA